MTNNTIDIMLAHRSVRSFMDRTVSDENLDAIIRAVQAAPNWVNLQLVSMIAVKDTDRRQRFAELCGHQAHIAEAPVFLVFCADYHRVALACQEKGHTLDEVMQDIDTLLVGAHEVGIALEAAVVAAESLGLGTVPIGDVRKNAKEVIRELQLSKYVFPMLGLCIGHPANDPGLKPRFPKEAVYFEETYNIHLEKQLAEYDKTYSQYLLKRPWNNRVGNWTDLAADFYLHPYHYKGVADVLCEQGFVSAKTDK
ncbi:NADPH-dependent oxidoreductase [Bacteroides salyersiae]|uniref:NADPH-dependent oxidoreductase n=1 Tax=Bacteroides salyersiae TaxID=291644 RepID=UPI0020798DB3|nr:NADPH-dependent oxidoreductase [Bacteroides salyersiae]